MQLLRRLLHSAGDVLLPVGSATYGEEAAFNTFLERGDLCVTVNTGMFGQVLTGPGAGGRSDGRGDQAASGYRRHCRPSAPGAVRPSPGQDVRRGAPGDHGRDAQPGARHRRHDPRRVSARALPGRCGLVPDLGAAAGRRVGHRHLLLQQPEVHQRAPGDRHRCSRSACLEGGGAALDPHPRPVSGPGHLAQLAPRAAAGARRGARRSACRRAHGHRRCRRTRRRRYLDYRLQGGPRPIPVLLAAAGAAGITARDRA